MNASEVFCSFVSSVLRKEDARRCVEIIHSKKGQKKLSEFLCHKFDEAIKPGGIVKTIQSESWNLPCFIFHGESFGNHYPSLKEAYDSLSLKDGWLIILENTSLGIYRPEQRWDEEKFILK